MSRSLFAILTAGLGIACSNGARCPVLLNPAFDVTVVDTSGNDLCNAVVNVTGPDSTTLRAYPMLDDAGCAYREETMVRAGTYSVTATLPGYQSATQSGVVITADACGQDSLATLTLTLVAGQ